MANSDVALETVGYRNESVSLQTGVFYSTATFAADHGSLIGGSEILYTGHDSPAKIATTPNGMHPLT
jgi:hypothetical protein